MRTLTLSKIGSFIKPHLPMIVSFALIAFVGLMPHAALAESSASGDNSNGMNFSSVNTSIENVIAFLTGPIMKVVAILAVLTGAIMLMQGRGMEEGIKTLAIVALCIGLLIGAVNIMNAVGASVLC